MEILVSHTHADLGRDAASVFYDEGYDVTRRTLDLAVGPSVAEIEAHALLALVVAERPPESVLGLLRRIDVALLKTPCLLIWDVEARADRVSALRAGVDDVLSAPCHADELAARFHAVLRRSKRNWDRRLRVGGLVLNLDRRSATIDRKRVPLTTREFRVLEVLALRKGSVLQREALLRAVYSDTDEPDRPDAKIIDVFVAKLRRKLLSASSGSTFIQPVAGGGFRLKDPEG